MTQYQSNVQSNVLEIHSPNNPYTYKSAISLHGDFGLAILYFVPQDGRPWKEPKTHWARYFRYLLLGGFLAARHRSATQRETVAVPVRRF
jgi:hypothetical protein